jgi:Patatin-like phospholipase
MFRCWREIWGRFTRAGGGHDAEDATHTLGGTAEPEKSDGGLLRQVPAKPRWEAMSSTLRRKLRAILYGARPEPVPSTLGLLEDPKAGKIGICCSGGGIRSAAFNLGALQYLQEKQELEKASYLAAVSGGSYIAAAFAMVAKCWHGEDRPGRLEEEHDDSDPAAFAHSKPFAKGSPEEQYLRNHSSYLAPNIPALTYLVLRVLLGLAYNLVFVSLPLFGAGMLLGEYVYRPHLPHLVGNCGSNCKPGVGWWWMLPVGVLALAVSLALAGMLRRTSDDEGALLRTWSVRLLYFAVLLALLLIATPALVNLLRPASANSSASASGAPKSGAVIGGSAGLAALVVGVVSQLREALVTPKKGYDDAQKGKEWLSKLSSTTRRWLAYLAGALIGPALLAGAYVYGVSVALANSPHGPRAWVFVVGVAAIALFALLYSFADLTSWSLHPFYKRRLCSTFALKRLFPKDLEPRERARVQTIPVGQPGSDAPVALERDYDKLVRLSQTAVKGSWPMLLVCAAANISDQGATPPGRSVTSFTFSANTVGGPLVGALPTTDMEAAFEDPKHGKGRYERARRFLHMPPRRRRLSDLSLPAAVAMSGAAISPSMGKLTKRPYRFLLALANIRLGVWTPNPRWVAAYGSKQTWRLGRPRPYYLFMEMIGRNRIGAKYLYVTDGGHYENLGLVELLRRGCTEIYCFDASGGEGFEVLGDAIALARSELGVEIGEINPKSVFPNTESVAKQMSVKLDFHYPERSGGGEIACRLVYARNVMTEGSPWDVLALHKADPNFPHNSTLDQFYTDQKFEGYRVLGERAGEAAVERMKRPAAGESAGR